MCTHFAKRPSGIHSGEKSIISLYITNNIIIIFIIIMDGGKTQETRAEQYTKLIHIWAEMSKQTDFRVVYFIRPTLRVCSFVCIFLLANAEMLLFLPFLRTPRRGFGSTNISYTLVKYTLQATRRSISVYKMHMNILSHFAKSQISNSARELW